MLKEIKIIDKEGEEIKPDKENLIVLPVDGKRFFIPVEQAKNIIEILKGQINNVSQTSSGKHKKHIDRKTGCTT